MNNTNEPEYEPCCYYEYIKLPDDKKGKILTDGEHMIYLKKKEEIKMTSELTSKTREELMYELKIKRFIKELKHIVNDANSCCDCEDHMKWDRLMASLYKDIDKKALEVFGKDIVE